MGDDHLEGEAEDSDDEALEFGYSGPPETQKPEKTLCIGDDVGHDGRTEVVPKRLQCTHQTSDFLLQGPVVDLGILEQSRMDSYRFHDVDPVLFLHDGSEVSSRLQSNGADDVSGLPVLMSHTLEGELRWDSLPWRWNHGVLGYNGRWWKLLHILGRFVELLSIFWSV